MPGDTAPVLMVSKWLRGEPVDHFEPGRVYVVDLWATWRAPCLATMPHLSRLQAQYRNDLTVIALNVWELQPGRVDATIAALGDSMAVTVALDSLPHGKEANEGLNAVAYMGSSEIVALPRTLLIDRVGKIVWIGTPRELTEPLRRVIDGTWEWQPFATTYTTTMEVELRYRELLGKVEAALEQADWDKAYRASEDVVAADPTYAPRIAHQGFTLIAMKILRMDPPGDAAIVARQAAERALELKHEPDWRISKLAADAARASGDLAGARTHLQVALETAPEKERASLTEALEAVAERP
jgi:thiol-disulfide isomerase/thioredoxin